MARCPRPPRFSDLPMALYSLAWWRPTVMYKLIDSSTVDFATIFEYYYIVGRSWWRWRRGEAAGSLYSSSVLLALINGCLFCRRWRFGFYFIHQRDVRWHSGLWFGLRTVDGYVCWIWESEILHLMLLFFRPTAIRRVMENLLEKSF